MKKDNKIVDLNIKQDELNKTQVNSLPEKVIECDDPSAEEVIEYDDTLEIVMPIDFDVLIAA